MATFTPMVRAKRKDGLYPVYIRIVHNSQPSYINTKKLVMASAVRRDGSISDAHINRYCYAKIEEYARMLNDVDTSNWEVSEVRKYLYNRNKGITFSEFCRKFIFKISKRGSDNNANVYRAALRNFEKFMESEAIRFEQITRNALIEWISSLSHTRRARTLYPQSLRVMYRAAREAATDLSSGIKGVESNAWASIEIPRYIKGEKRAITAEACRQFFSAAIPDDARWRERGQLGRDVAMMVMCLAGINTVDLYKLRKKDYRDGIIRYRRSKTASRRDDGAYFEIRVPAVLEELIARYVNTKNDSDNLFWFASKYSDAKIFNVTVNEGIKRVCESMGISDEDHYSAYTFRHSWATIAQNDCSATIPEVGFAMNHSQTHGVTRGYVKIDFSPAWRLNEKVVDFVFFSNSPSKLALRDRAAVEENTFNVTCNTMVYARAYFRGEVIGEHTGMGYANPEAVIDAMTPQIKQRGRGNVMHFRIKDVDSGREAVFERVV